MSTGLGNTIKCGDKFPNAPALPKTAGVQDRWPTQDVSLNTWKASACIRC